MRSFGDVIGVNNTDVFYNIAEDLRVPFYRILNELSLEESKGNLKNQRNARTIADAALKLLDGYILTTKLKHNQQQFNIEPVSAHAVLYESSQQLGKLARLHNFDILLNLQKSVGQIIANHQALGLAITSLAYSFLYDYDPANRHKNTLLFNLHSSTKDTVEIGVYSSDSNISSGSLRRLRQLKGRARQPLSELSFGSNSGLIIADELFCDMNSKLVASRYNKLKGVKAMLMPSKQLSLC